MGDWKTYSFIISFTLLNGNMHSFFEKRCGVPGLEKTPLLQVFFLLSHTVNHLGHILARPLIIKVKRSYERQKCQSSKAIIDTADQIDNLI